jgi:hypothetical protein
MRDEPLDEADDEADEEPTRPRAAINPWPLLAVLVVAILSWFGYQAWHLQREHRSLVQIRASSEAPLDQARKRRAQLESIMRRTFELAQKGNPGATFILQELARRGVTINPAPPGTPPGTPAPSAPAPAAPAPPK